MNQEEYNFWMIILQVLTVVVAGLFAFWQARINSRLKELQDFVAISIFGFFAENEPKIQIKNVGRINLYLHKWEIEGSGETYKKSRLLGCSPDLSFIIPVSISNQVNTTLKVKTDMSVKIYLTDEYGQKYISEGALSIRQQASPIIQNQAIDSTQAQQQAMQQYTLQRHIFAWSYKTIKKKWLL